MTMFNAGQSAENGFGEPFEAVPGDDVSIPCSAMDKAYCSGRSSEPCCFKSLQSSCVNVLIERLCEVEAYSKTSILPSLSISAREYIPFPSSVILVSPLHESSPSSLSESETWSISLRYGNEDPDDSVERAEG